MVEYYNWTENPVPHFGNFVKYPTEDQKRIAELEKELNEIKENYQ